MCAIFPPETHRRHNGRTVEVKHRNRITKTFLILSGLVLVSSVVLLAKSLDTFLQISTPKPLNNPPSENTIAASAEAPTANPPAAPAVTISSLTMFLIMDLICYLKQLDYRMF